jgi:transposase
MVSMDNVDQLGVLLYGACTGIRSSRQIERRRQEDISIRVLSGNGRLIT